MHPQHDQLLRDLICRAARSDQIPGDLSVIDAGWEFRGLLARVAAESSEADWSPEVAGMIGQARVELARSARSDDLGGAASWETSNRQAREALLGLLARQTDDRMAVTAGGAGWSSSTRRRRTSARPARRCSGCLADETHWAAWTAGALGPARPDGGGQAPGPRGAARVAGRRDRRWAGAAGGRAGAGSTRRRRTSARPVRRCSGCWPASRVQGWDGQ